jgi:hypothetical protein
MRNSDLIVIGDRREKLIVIPAQAGIQLSIQPNE